MGSTALLRRDFVLKSGAPDNNVNPPLKSQYESRVNFVTRVVPFRVVNLIDTVHSCEQTSRSRCCSSVPQRSKLESTLAHTTRRDVYRRLLTLSWCSQLRPHQLCKITLPFKCLYLRRLLLADIKCLRRPLVSVWLGTIIVLIEKRWLGHFCCSVVLRPIYKSLWLFRGFNE